MNSIIRCQNWSKLSLTFVFIFLAIIALAGCSPSPAPTPTPTPVLTTQKLLAPHNGATNSQLNLTFLWEAVPNAGGYELIIAHNYDFSDIYWDVSTKLTNYQFIEGLEPSSQYYWMVCAKLNPEDVNTPIAYSEVWTFTTAPAPTTNRAPYIPSNPSPPNHAIDISTFTLSWSGGDPDQRDSGTYDVYFGFSTSPPLVSQRQSGTTYVPSGSLPFPVNTKCYWKIIATDSHGSSTEGPLWDFTTTAELAIKPPFVTANAPIGPSTGNVNQVLTFSASVNSNIAGSPEYRFDWGDGSYSSWSSSSSASHSWSSPNTYVVRAQARYPSITSEWSSGKDVKIETQTLSRRPFGQPEQMKRYVTPDDPKVKATVNDILSGEWRWAYNDFNALRAWVVLNVSPMSDQEAHGVAEYWQLPAETLELGTGDCEDYAILLCTLLRAHGVPADQVYVIGGCPSEGERGHAFLYEHWYKGIWRAIEPQVDPITDTLTFEIMGWADAVTYIRDVWCFNDESCFQGKPPLPLGVYEFEVDYSFWPATRGASVEFEGHLDTGREVSGTVEWAKENQIIYDWSLYIYAPDGNTALSWSGTDLQHTFNFTAITPGIYKIEILKRDYLARCARLTIDPPDWQ